MKKIFVTAENIDNYVCPKTNKIYHDASLILSSQVKDICKKRNIEIVYNSSSSHAPSFRCGQGKQVFSACLNDDTITQLIVSLVLAVKEKHNINDMQLLRKITAKIIKVIKKNIL